MAARKWYVSYTAKAAIADVPAVIATFENNGWIIIGIIPTLAAGTTTAYNVFAKIMGSVDTTPTNPNP
jgi:hypothetical protein